MDSNLVPATGAASVGVAGGGPSGSAYSADLQQNLTDSLDSLHKLAVGMDVNVRFNSVFGWVSWLCRLRVREVEVTWWSQVMLTDVSISQLSLDAVCVVIITVLRGKRN